MTLRSLATLLVVAIAAGLAGAWWGRFSTPEPPSSPIAPPETVYAERDLLPADTAGADLPDVVTLYDTVRTERVDTIAVPVPTMPPKAGGDRDDARPFRPHGLIGPDPVQVGGRTFTLTYWRPPERRWVQATYRADRRRNALSIYGRADLLPSTTALSSGLRYSRTVGRALGASVRAGVHGGYAITPHQDGPAGGAQVHIRWSW